MQIEEICQLVPPVDKKLKNALKELSKKQLELKNKRDSFSEKNQMSQKQLKDSEKDALIKKKTIKIRNKTMSKKPDIIKPKMVDAWTQTERSDFALIKYKMQKKLQAKSLEKNKLNMMLNSQTTTDGSHSAIRTTNLGSHESLTTKMSSTFKAVSSSNVKKSTPLGEPSMKNYSQMPLKIGLTKSAKRHGQDTSKSQVTPGVSRNPMKAPAKRTMLQVNKKKRVGKMRLPSIQASRDKKTRD